VPIKVRGCRGEEGADKKGKPFGPRYDDDDDDAAHHKHIVIAVYTC
jgi:hypothetical protein